jgi:hypothetical protein
MKGVERNPISSPPRFVFFFLSTVFSIFLRASFIACTTMGSKHLRLSQQQEADQIRQTMQFYTPSGSSICVDELKGWVIDKTNKHGATLLMDAN